MAYRFLKAEVTVAQDSSLTHPLFGPFPITCYQTLDRKVATPTVLVGPSDAEATISIAPVSTGYFWAIFADYPVRYRINGASETQFTMHTNNVAAVNAGSPLPPQCFACGTSEITSLRLQPIASAAQTATVWIVVVGDPLNSYT